MFTSQGMDSIAKGDYVEGEEQEAWEDPRSFRGKGLGVCLRQGQIIPHLSLVHTRSLPRKTAGSKVKVLGLRTASGVWEFRWSLNSTLKIPGPTLPSLLWLSSGVASSRKPSLTIGLS